MKVFLPEIGVAPALDISSLGRDVAELDESLGPCFDA
jgi:hypothetical protein